MGGRRGTLILAVGLMAGLIWERGERRAERSHPLVNWKRVWGHHPGVYPTRLRLRGQFLGTSKPDFFDGPFFTGSSRFMIQARSGCKLNKKPTRAPIKNEADNA